MYVEILSGNASLGEQVQDLLGLSHAVLQDDNTAG